MQMVYCNLIPSISKGIDYTIVNFSNSKTGMSIAVTKVQIVIPNNNIVKANCSIYNSIVFIDWYNSIIGIVYFVVSSLLDMSHLGFLWQLDFVLACYSLLFHHFKLFLPLHVLKWNASRILGWLHWTALFSLIMALGKDIVRPLGKIERWI